MYFQEKYPVKEFLALRRKYDPNNILANRLINTLF
jgi:hypothetical protein